MDLGGGAGGVSESLGRVEAALAAAAAAEEGNRKGWKWRSDMGMDVEWRWESAGAV